MTKKTVTIMLLVVFTVGVWALSDPNARNVLVPYNTRPFPAQGSSEGAVPYRVVNEGDVPAGYQPAEPEPVFYEPPRVIAGLDDGSPGENPRTLWGPDVLVRPGGLRSPTPFGSERMIAYDQTSSGVLFAGGVVASGDTFRLYRSTDAGYTWALFGGVIHPGNVLSSPELVVAEGDSSFVFLFFKSSAGNGDIYCARYTLAGAGTVFSVKVDSDTIVNLSACKDRDNPYYLYVTFEKSEGYPSVYTWRSTNYGRTWADAEGRIVNTWVQPKPDICCGENGRIYLFCLDKRQSSVDSASFRVKISTDRGNTWELSTQVGTPAVRVFDGVCAARHLTQTVWLVHVRDMEPWNGMGLGVFYYYSTDNGATWNYGGNDGIGHADTDNNELMPSIATSPSGSPTVCYAIVPSESLMFTWCSRDTNWIRPIKVNDNIHTGGFPPQAGWKTTGSFSYSTVLYAGAGPSDLWFDSWDMTGVNEVAEMEQLPVIVKPNPVRGRAEINWTVNQPGLMELVIHDVSGRQVEVLTRGNRNAGAHRAVWNCARMPAGVYLYRLNTSGNTYTGRIVLAH